MLREFSTSFFQVVLLVALLSSCFQTKKLNEIPGNTLLGLESFTLEKIQKEQVLVETEKVLTTLSSDEFEGRKPGLNGFELCVDYVEGHMKKNNIKPFFETGYRDTLINKGITTYNIVGLIGDKSDNGYILIGAHLDHIGKLKSDKDSIYNGANDNASGVTAVLQISKELAKYNFDQSIIVALFTEEEVGLVGSKHLAERLKKDGINLTYVLNFEMLGKTLTTGENQVYITGYNKSNLAEEMNKAKAEKFVYFLPAEIRYQLFSRSDNFPFYAEFKIPSHTISTFDFENYEHYHKATDEVTELDIENMHEIINSSTYIIGEFLKKNTVIEIKEK